MGVMSRKVVPVCGKLCFFCPALRSRSRQPVKRYKKILASIFPRTQDAEPNDRMIGKLCDYVSKNTPRIPDITAYLEQKCFKDLRHGRIYLVRVIPRIYRRMLSSCKEQMPLLAPSSLIIASTLLDQTQENELRTLACLLLTDFLNNQVDGAYMFNIEGMIPKLCDLGFDRDLEIRSSALQTLASLVQYMGEHSHVSVDFDNIVRVTMDNYKTDQNASENESQEEPQNYINTVMDASKKNPWYWSRVCLQNMAKLAKEATTVRRVLDPLLRYFDGSDSWSPESGIAFPVLSEMQSSMDSSGKNSHILLSIIIKHVDNKNITRQPKLLIDILKVATKLAMQEKVQASISLITAISDLIRHFRKCLQFAIDTSDANLDADVSRTNSQLHSALEECLFHLIEKVGEVGPILDILAVVLENISQSTNIARSTISCVYRTAKIVSSLPNLSYNQKGFPEALLQQLLQTMAHRDHGTRVGSHRIFSAILAPQFESPWCNLDLPIPLKEYDAKITLLVALSSFSSSSSLQIGKDNNGCIIRKKSLNEHAELVNGDCKDDEEEEEDKNENGLKSVRLSGQQVGLFLSSIWNQAFIENNTPTNYEAMAHTFNLTLHFSRTKNSSHAALIRCFQLAFSLKNLSFNHQISLQASRKRCLYTLSTSMLILSAKACDLREIESLVKSTMPNQFVDSHLSLKEDSELGTVFLEDSGSSSIYGSDEDELAATEFLSNLSKDDLQLKETLVSHLLQKFDNLPEENTLREELFKEFSPDESFLFGAPYFMEAPRPCSPYNKGSIISVEDFDASVMEDDDAFFEISTSQSDLRSSNSNHSNEVISVNKLIESVMATTALEASSTSSSFSRNHVSFDQMKNNCEALILEKQQKWSALLSFKFDQDSSKLFLEDSHNEASSSYEYESKENSNDKENNVIRCDSLSSGSENSFRLPPASPYDKFLIAAGQ